MKRNEFVKLSVLTGAATMLGKTMVHATNLLDSPFLQQVALGFNSCNRVLVIIQLTGGNDGLNCIIPIDSYHHWQQQDPILFRRRHKFYRLIIILPQACTHQCRS